MKKLGITTDNPIFIAKTIIAARSPAANKANSKGLGSLTAAA